MPSTVAEVAEHVGVEEWESLVNGSGEATFFHTPLWYRAFLETWPRTRLVLKRFAFDDGTVAVFPLLEQQSATRFARRYVSGPAGCYGGWVSSATLRPEQVRAITAAVLPGARNLRWRINPLEPAKHLLEPHTTIPDSTEILFLRNFADEDSLLKHYRHNVRKQVKKARKANLSVRVATEWNEWEQHYALYTKSLARWGNAATSNYGLDLFRKLYGFKSSKIRLWLVTAGDRIVGGNLNLYHNEHCVEWHAAFDSEFFRVGSRNFLVHNIILDAVDKQFRYYDFNPSGGHDGARRFKRAFGTTSVSSDLIVKSSALAGVSERLKTAAVSATTAIGRLASRGRSARA
jgi:CelD/BcsL family acetyltransferase involved in cellulose biosynthesis